MYITSNYSSTEKKQMSYIDPVRIMWGLLVARALSGNRLSVPAGALLSEP